jgi:surface protein
MLRRWGCTRVMLVASVAVGAIASLLPLCEAANVDHDRALKDKAELWITNKKKARSMYGHIGTWDTSKVTSMRKLFYIEDFFNEDLNGWNVSGVTNMFGLFDGATEFKSDLSSWDVSRVQQFGRMFADAQAFTGDLSLWDVSKAHNFDSMFYFASAFTSDLSSWDLSTAKSMEGMFENAFVFTSDISSWDVASVTTMAATFSAAQAFTSDLATWDVHNVARADDIFNGAMDFNSDLSSWDISKVTTSARMFAEASVFTSNLSSWDVSEVLSTDSMFFKASKFASILNAWDVSSVRSMGSMFSKASKFASDISAWDVSGAQTLDSMFAGASSFKSELSAWDVSGALTLDSMFASASTLTSNLSAWDVSGARSMRSMFSKASSFASDLSAWDVSGAQTLDSMFSEASRFNSDLSAWDLSGATSTVFMFSRASKFTSDLSSWDVANILAMDSMFAEASTFKSDLSVWPVQHLATKQGMFDDAGVESLPCWYVGTSCSIQIAYGDDRSARKKLNPNLGLSTVDPTKMSATNTYRVGTTYRIAPLAIRVATAHTFSLVDAPEGFYINPITGVVLATFGVEDTTVNGEPVVVTLQVIADTGDRRADVERYTMFVEDRENSFKLVLEDGPKDAVYLQLDSDGVTPTLVLVDEPFRLAPPIVNQYETVLSSGGVSDIRFTFNVFDTVTKTQISEELSRVAIKPNGELVGEFGLKELGKYTFVVTAIDGGRESFQLEPFMLDVRQSDVNIPEYGPNKRGCANNGLPVDDSGDMYDGIFTSCNCSALLFVGDNCDAECAAGTSKDIVSGTCVGKKMAGNATTLLSVAAGALALLVLLAVSAARFHQHRVSMRPIDFDELNRKMLENGTIMEGQLLSDRRPRELNRSSLVLLEQVGRGAFGAVWKAMLHESGRPEYQVAAKTVLNADASPEATADLTTEAVVMAQLAGHKNLVSIIGVVTSGSPLILVLSYCDHGSMLSHLRKCVAAGKAVSGAHKLDFVVQTARGMAHLSERHFIHRDLAARNVLLTSGLSLCKLVCKVADFGLSRGGSDLHTNDSDGRENYYRSQNGVFPVRWTAPEAMEQLKFTQASDIWSFGIVIVEIIQDGANPYPNIKSNPDVVLHTISGGCHPQPSECSTNASMLMLYTAAATKCFSAIPTARPTFIKLAKIVEGLMATDHGTDVDGAIAPTVSRSLGSAVGVSGDAYEYSAASGHSSHDGSKPTPNILEREGGYIVVKPTEEPVDDDSAHQRTPPITALANGHTGTLGNKNGGTRRKSHKSTAAGISLGTVVVEAHTRQEDDIDDEQPCGFGTE